MLKEIEAAIHQGEKVTVYDIMRKTRLTYNQVMIGLEHLVRMGRLKEEFSVQSQESVCATGTLACKGCPFQEPCQGVGVKHYGFGWTRAGAGLSDGGRSGI